MAPHETFHKFTPPKSVAARQRFPSVYQALKYTVFPLMMTCSIFVSDTMGLPDAITMSASLPTYPVCNPRMFCRIDGNCLQGVKLVHAGFYRKPGAQCQILLGNHRRICDNRHLASCPGKISRRLNTLFFQLEFCCMPQSRSYRHRISLPCQIIRNQRTIRTVVKGKPEMKFLCNPNGRINIICLMDMRLQRKQSLDDWNQRLHPCIPPPVSLPDNPASAAK